MLVVAFLATALIAGNASCSNSSDDSDNTVTNPSQWPAYYIDEEFGGQRFVDTEDWYHDDVATKNQKFTARYKDAGQYLDSKVDELQKLWQEKNTGSALSNQIGTALSNFNQGTTIDEQIKGNYDTLAPVFAMMGDSLIEDVNVVSVDFHRFNVSYQKLAADAFNQSIGKYALNETKKFFKTNTEIANTYGSVWDYELDYANLTYTEAADRDQAKARMNGYLTTLASQTNTDMTVLKKVVELALYNESLYGLNDFAVQCGVSNSGLNKIQRSLNTFDHKVDHATYSISDTQSLDDRMM